MRGVMRASDLNDLRQCTLYIKFQSAFIGSLCHFAHTRDILNPFYRGRVGETDLHLALADIFEGRNMIDRDQLSLTDDRHAVAGVLDLWQDVRGEEDRAPLGVYLGDHFVEFLLVERIEAAGWLVQDQ